MAEENLGFVASPPFAARRRADGTARESVWESFDFAQDKIR
jgi:hypothetical protein